MFNLHSNGITCVYILVKFDLHFNVKLLNLLLFNKSDRFCLYPGTCPFLCLSVVSVLISSAQAISW